MILDIILLAIVILNIVFGFRRGFIYTFSHTLGWFGAVLAAFFLAPSIRSFLSSQTKVSTSIYDSLHDKFALSNKAATDSIDSLPSLISSKMHSLADSTAALLASNITTLIMTLLGFAFALIIIKALLFFLIHFFSKKESRGFIGFFDGFLGLIAGAMKGFLLVFILLALLVPMVNLLSPKNAEAVLNILDASYLARSLYDSNFIILILHAFFS